MNDADIAAAVAEIAKGEQEREAQEVMAGEYTHTVNGEQVTMTELEWFDLFGRVSFGCKWATQVMTWMDMERALVEFVGFSDNVYEQLDTPEKRRKELFDEGIATTDAWQRPMDTWKPIALVGQVLQELGYFDNPVDMVQWMMRADGAPDDVVAQLERMKRDLLGDDEEGGG